jgi:hypothetical protein
LCENYRLRLATFSTFVDESTEDIALLFFVLTRRHYLDKPQCCRKTAMTNLAGTLGAYAGSHRFTVGHFQKALERNFLNVKHECPLPRLWRDWTSLLVKSSVTHLNPIKPAFQGVGSVPGGSAQCNDEVKTGFCENNYNHFISLHPHLCFVADFCCFLG